MSLSAVDNTVFNVLVLAVVELAVAEDIRWDSLKQKNLITENPQHRFDVDSLCVTEMPLRGENFTAYAP